jgi:two-component system response regulator YesN
MYKVLIADDDSLFRSNLIHSIDWNAYGLSVAGEAGDGCEALEVCGKIQPDIFICDIKMPVQDGLSVLKSLNNPVYLKFIVLSGYNDFEFTKQAIMYGAFDYALKPLNVEELSGILMRAVESLNSDISRRRQDIESNIGLRKFMVEKYESLFIHFIESRDAESICEYIDNFYSELASSGKPDMAGSSLTEFLILADKVCTMFKLDTALILDRFKPVASSSGALLQPSSTPELVKKIFTGIINQLIMAKNSQCRKIIDEVVSYIDNNYCEKISLESISKRYFINPSYFSQVFKAKMGESFTSYLISVRIKKAKELLSLDKFKVYQVAEMVGYDSEKHFCQIFKKYTGLSPTDYKHS